MQVALGERMEKAFRYKTGLGEEETLFMTDKKLVWQRAEKTDEIAYPTIAQVEKTVQTRTTGGCVFFCIFCFLSLLCGGVAIFYGVDTSEIPYYLAGGVLAVWALVCFVLSVKLKRKEFGVKLRLDGQSELWLDIGDKKLSALVANEIVAKVWNS
ncbi:MAG: hypothetical protein IJ506_03615 [Clostridia bacterium]|nr:hypothetical protein [Clostridia bacterium]